MEVVDFLHKVGVVNKVQKKILDLSYLRISTRWFIWRYGKGKDRFLICRALFIT